MNFQPEAIRLRRRSEYFAIAPGRLPSLFTSGKSPERLPIHSV
jgi:hypothetical protein